MELHGIGRPSQWFLAADSKDNGQVMGYGRAMLTCRTKNTRAVFQIIMKKALMGVGVVGVTLAVVIIVRALLLTPVEYESVREEPLPGPRSLKHWRRV